MLRNRRKSKQEARRKGRDSNGHSNIINAVQRRKKEKEARQKARIISELDDCHEEKEEMGYDSPPRPKMPKEIKITPGTPDSAFSAVSSATGLGGLPEQFKPPKSMSMFKSVLPEMSSETEDCSSSSMDRSTFTWGTTTNPNIVKPTIIREDEPCDVGAIVLSGSTIFDDDGSDIPSKTLLFASPKKANLQQNKEETMLTRSKFFEKIVNYSFDVIDSDGSGTIDKKELYAGLVLIHLKLAAYVGPAACRPATREYVDEMFDTLDQDQNGSLDREEFRILMTILCSQITSRVFVQLSVALMIVPLISNYVVDCIKSIMTYMGMVLKEIDDKEVVSEFLVGLLEYFWDLAKLLTPPILQRFVLSIYENLEIDTMPLTFISCLLGCMIVPWLLYKCDEFHNYMASRESKVVKSNTNNFTGTMYQYKQK